MKKGIFYMYEKKRRDLVRPTRFFFMLDDKKVTVKKWLNDPRAAAVADHTQKQIRLVINRKIALCALNNDMQSIIDYNAFVQSGATFEEIVAYAVRNLGFNCTTKGIRDC